MSKQEYSQAVRDVVRAIGKHGWVGFDNMLRDLDARNVWIAKRDGLVTMAMICASSTFVLTDKGRELLREMQGEEKAPKSDRYPMCTDQPAQIDCRRAACQYHGVGDGCTNSSPAITLKEDSYHVTCWSFKVREPHPEPEPGGYCSKEDCINRNPATRRCTLSEPRVVLPEFARASCLDYRAPTPDPLCSVCGKPASEHRDGLFCCPFCGGTTGLEFVYTTTSCVHLYRAECQVCVWKMGRYVPRADAIEAGNRRA